MKLAILLTTSMLLTPLLLFALVLGVPAPLLPALLFAVLIISAGVMGQWIGILTLILARAILVPLAIALLVVWTAALAEVVTAQWIFLPILMVGVGVVALIVGLTTTEVPFNAGPGATMPPPRPRGSLNPLAALRYE